ncbi:AAA family ATPase [Thauera sp. AutoDN2]|uniref:AAA family ATPase n=1 Tax=Thauera sp. AutoDN2 TaxID=3416051 RepID=UPI003F4BADD1
MHGNHQLSFPAKIAIFILGVSMVVSGLLALPMLASRLFPADGVFPSQDSYFLYATVIQVLLVFAMSTATALVALGRDPWQVAAVMTAVPVAIVLTLAGTAFRLFPDFVMLGVALLAMYAAEWMCSHEGSTVAHSPAATVGNQKALAQMQDLELGDNDLHARAARRFPARRVQRTFRDMIGMIAVKERLLTAGNEILATRAGTPAARNGVLLFGEPGNGKTVFAEALAGELGLPMITATFGDVASRWINQTTEQVMQAFRAAHAQAPCVLFLDEVDSLIRDRAHEAGTSEESARTTNALLTEIVRVRDSRIVLVAATNHIDRLDPAAIREGRFDYRVEITPPDGLARAGLLRSQLDALCMPFEDQAIETAAARWDGFSVARIRAVAEDAGRSARLEGAVRLTYAHLQAALRRVQGRAGHLPADTPDLDGLTLPEALHRTLVGLAERMRKVEQLEAFGARLPSGVLFHGEPGTGKTIAARALARHAGWAFLAATGSELLHAPERIDVLSKQARDLRPAIVFIDEADDLLADRQFGSLATSATNRLLSSMDGAGGQCCDVVWIAATNHPEHLDPAAMRGGRFTVKVAFERPDMDTVKAFVTRWIGNSKAPFARDASPQAIATLVADEPLANVQAVLQHAVDVMVERWIVEREPGTCEVSLAHLADARQAVLGR